MDLFCLLLIIMASFFLSFFLRMIVASESDVTEDEGSVTCNSNDENDKYPWRTTARWLKETSLMLKAPNSFFLTKQLSD